MNEQQTIFLVDDEPAVLRALSRMLRAAGYETQVFNSGQEFMDAYDPIMAGCLVLDLSMPGMTGPDVQRWVNGLPSPLPIIFLTGRDDAHEREQALMQGAVDVLMKPGAASVLLGSIQKAFAADGEARKP